MSTHPETKHEPGVYYVRTRAGLELPIVDVTHPAFALAPTEAEQAALVEAFLNEPQPLAQLPAFLRRPLLRFLLRGSVLGRAIGGAQGTYLGGMDTYLLKLGADNLGASATPIDRRIAASLPALAVRWRLQDVARLLADGLAPGLAAHPRAPLRMVNIAGGPAIDSLNALRILRREQAASLAGRRAQIDVLDLDADGPAFGARALDAWRAPGAPLHDLEVTLRHTRYDWSQPGGLRAVLDGARADDAVAAGSSEGGLFEYGSDDDILANLACLRDAAPPDFVMVGSVTRADALTRRLYRAGGPAVRPRGSEVFRALAARGGWKVARLIERPFSDQVALVRA